ncbi:hypothetical protein [Gracilimonas tropica]|uniref:hypothetical protein n=1 Tax=Gracilimonas tropica TaxID=454600 RepID=UPI00037355CF|nr:hypothetical protein [Gracilimonas tropica]
MNTDLHKHYSKFLNTINWDYFVSMRKYRNTSAERLLSIISKWVYNSKAIEIAFTSIENDIIPGNFHSHTLVKLKNIKFKYHQFKLEAEKFEKEMDYDSTHVNSNVKVSAYCSKYITKYSTYDFLCSKKPLEVLKEEMNEFIRLAYYARRGDLKRAYVNFELGNYLTERWEVNSLEVNSLVGFLYKCGSQTLEMILRDLIRFVRLNPYGNSKPLDLQNLEIEPTKNKMNLITEILKILSENNYLCSDLDQFLRPEINPSHSSYAA